MFLWQGKKGGVYILGTFFPWQGKKGGVYIECWISYHDSRTVNIFINIMEQPEINFKKIWQGKKGGVYIEVWSRQIHCLSNKLYDVNPTGGESPC